MNLIKLSWKNLTNKPLSMLLSLILFALGVGLISFLLLLNKQVQEKFEKNLAGIDLVIGAKGSPLQMILCSMYHIDSPTGNISIKEAKPFLNPQHPLIGKAIPLSMGDSYKGYRIIGTTHDFVELYEGAIQEGRLWSNDFEVTIGAGIAADLGLKIGDKFDSSHGFVIDDNLVHDHKDKFVVVGILHPSGSVLDQLVLTKTQSVWKVHDHSEEDGHDHGAEESHEGHDHDDHEGHDHSTHDDHDHAGHDHDDHEGHDHSNHDDHDHAGHDHAKQELPTTTTKVVASDLMQEDETKEITSLLVKFKNRSWQTLNMKRSIDENTDMQAASPAIEMNRLYSMMGVGTDALRVLAIVIIIVSALSIFISLFNSLKERKYELALMRVMGASRGKLFLLIIIEGLILAALGYVIGIALSHIGMEVLAGYMKDSYRYSFSGKIFLPEELKLLFGALFIGFIAAIIPAIQAFQTNISKTLAKN